MHSIKYYSTNLKAAPVSFGEALLTGQAPDQGLFMPEHIPTFSSQELTSMAGRPYPEIAFIVLNAFLKNDLPESVLKKLVDEAYNYPVPLEHVYEQKYVMRLDQGPTASFKDFAARMMGRLMSYFLAKRNHGLLILTATSGDTGSAIANAFYGLENINVLVLFPESEVTPRQRKQMTTLGKNVRTLAVDGKFDDCQAMVKKAFADSALHHLNLSSANSINIGRLLPQAVYYFYAWSQLCRHPDKEAVFVVPSGNFGDMMGGMIAWSMGLPIKRMVIAVNENDEFPNFLKTGVYQKIEPSRNCLSSAMNVGHPSNLSRLLAMYGGVMDEKGNIAQAPELELMRDDIYAVSVNDEMTKQTIRNAWNEYKLLLEPHGAVGWAGLMHYLQTDNHAADQVYVVFETAHPAKFPEQVTDILGFDPELPLSLKGLEERDEYYEHLPNNYTAFKKYLETNYK